MTEKQTHETKDDNSQHAAALEELCALLGVQTSYLSAYGHEEKSSVESLVTIINALGVPLKKNLSNVQEVFDDVLTKHWKTPADHVAVFWEGKPQSMLLRVPESASSTVAEAKFILEDGRELKTRVKLAEAEDVSAAEVDGVPYIEKEVLFDVPLPFGYHELQLALSAKSKVQVFLIVAPAKAYHPNNPALPQKSLGVFAPLYALRSEKSWGIGDFTDMARFRDWAYTVGCDFIGSLPMLATFNDKPFVEPSPYSPVSRVFWNEVFVDPRRTAEWLDCAEARKIAGSPKFLSEVAKHQAEREVDWKAVWQLKRPITQRLAREFFKKKRDRSPEFKEFMRIKPQAADYAEFRAACDKQGSEWYKWSSKARGDYSAKPKPAKLGRSDYRDEDKQFYLYAQFLAHQQLTELSRDAETGGHGLYIDFPLSAHASGYDVWRERDSFAEEATAGCPPDPSHVHGQNWGILPLHPKRIRETRYRYFRSCLENHMMYAGYLRLDHVMGFYRLFWVPKNRSAKEGVYVRYNVDEFFALLVLESHRNKCILIGEDLGTVPPEIRTNMNEHGILRMYVQQRKLHNDPVRPFEAVPEDCICSLNTHDMPHFASYWKALDVHDKLDLDYFKPEQLPEKLKEREDCKDILVQHLRLKGLLPQEADRPGQSNRELFADEGYIKKVLHAMLRLSARGPARVVQVNLEDLWLEILQQNMPGTWRERPNWKRKARYGINELPRLRELAPLFAELTQLREKSATEGPEPEFTSVRG